MTQKQFRTIAVGTRVKLTCSAKLYGHFPGCFPHGDVFTAAGSIGTVGAVDCARIAGSRKGSFVCVDFLPGELALMRANGHPVSLAVARDWTKEADSYRVGVDRENIELAD